MQAKVQGKEKVTPILLNHQDFDSQCFCKQFFVTYDSTITLIKKELKLKDNKAFQMSYTSRMRAYTRKLIHMAPNKTVLWETTVPVNSFLEFLQDCILLSDKEVLMLDLDKRQLHIYYLQKKMVKIIDYKFFVPPKVFQNWDEDSNIEISLAVFPDSQLICLIQSMENELQLTYFHKTNIGTIYRRFKHTNTLNIVDPKPINLSSKICWYTIENPRSFEKFYIAPVYYKYSFYFYDIEEGLREVSFTPDIKTKVLNRSKREWMQTPPNRIELKAELNRDQFIAIAYNYVTSFCDQELCDGQIPTIFLLKPFQKQINKELVFKYKDDTELNIDLKGLTRFNVRVQQNTMVVEFDYYPQKFLFFLDINDRKVFFDKRVEQEYCLSLGPERNILILKHETGDMFSYYSEYKYKKLKLIPFVYPKDLFMQMLLFFNDHFDDDLLYDTISLIDMI